METAIAIGPLMMAVDRGLAVLCIAVFLGLTTLAGRFRFPRVSTVATSAIVTGLVAARIGYVAAHWASYIEAPLSIFAVWQGASPPSPASLVLPRRWLSSLAEHAPWRWAGGHWQ
ncbi:hypothetical protein [Sphingomonas aerolata]|uniref:hypothetical protein n=1 Tax=Sphingomonas aerolata TaxID=185951 RepID=UPI002FE0EB71